MAHRVLFLGTPDFAEFHLRSLARDSRYELVAVVSQPDRPAGRKMQLQPSPVKKAAISLGLPIQTPESAKDSAFLSWVKDLGADAAVVVAYGQILSENFLNIFPQRVVNVHASLLPRWRGAAPIQRALMAGDRVTGVSLQVMEKALDAGDVIAESTLAIPEDMDAIQLHDRLKEMGAQLLTENLAPFLEGKVRPKPQDVNQVTYAKKIEKAESAIDWNLSADEIYNRFRGLALGPGVRSSLRGVGIKFHRMNVVEHRGGLPGELVSISEEGIAIACGEGALLVTELQPDSRARMSSQEFVRGYDVKKGDQFV